MIAGIFVKFALPVFYQARNKKEIYVGQSCRVLWVIMFHV
jgi:hypothetical protein